jgi:agmatinase
VLPACFTQLGIRSAGERSARDHVAERGGQIFTARALRGLESPVQLAPVLASVRERLLAHGSPPLYLSLDIDCLDPAFAPGTGTPEPGGLSSNQVLSLLEGLAALPCVGMDCVEVSPPYDHAELSSQAAAHFVWTYLCGQRALADNAAPAGERHTEGVGSAHMT